MTSTEPDEFLWAKMTVPHLSRHGVGPDRKKSYKLTEKVDQHGNYLEFPKITVVHPLSKRQKNKLSSLPLRLQQTVGAYLSPLPSYHVTLLRGPLHADLNGPGRQPGSNLFAECLQEPCWERMVRYLEKKQYAPTNLVLGDVVCRTSGGVMVYLHDGNIAATKQIRQELREIGICENKLKESLETLVARKDLGKKALRTAIRLLSSLMETTEWGWHITIAYPRKSGGPMPKEVQEQVKIMVRDAFETETGYVSMEPARLCLSADLTSFAPWNGKPPYYDLQLYSVSIHKYETIEDQLRNIFSIAFLSSPLVLSVSSLFPKRTNKTGDTISNDRSEKKHNTGETNLAKLTTAYWWIPAVFALGTLLMGGSGSSRRSKSTASS